MTTSTEPLTAWEIELADSLLVDVDLSRDVPCDAEGCVTGAEWMLSGPCTHDVRGCTPHRHEAEAWFEEHPLMHPVCIVCDTPRVYPFQWRPL